jgi:hypothetical protein
MTAEQPGTSGDDRDVEERRVHQRARLLPEEEIAGTDDAYAQADAILTESNERTEHPDPDADSRSGRRTSADTV